MESLGKPILKMEFFSKLIVFFFKYSNFIFKKVSSDISKFFGFDDDEPALKMISHEMKGLRAVLGTEVPLFIPVRISFSLNFHKFLLK